MKLIENSAAKLDYTELVHTLAATQHMLMRKKGFAPPMMVTCEKDGRILFTFEMDSHGDCQSPFNRDLPAVDLPVFLSVTDRSGNIFQARVGDSLWRRIHRVIRTILHS